MELTYHRITVPFLLVSSRAKSLDLEVLLILGSVKLCVSAKFAYTAAYCPSKCRSGLKRLKARSDESRDQLEIRPHLHM